MRSEFTLKRREGVSKGALHDSVPDDTEQRTHSERVEYINSDRRLGGLIQQQTRWETVAPIGVSEELTLSTRWGLLLYSGVFLAGLGIIGEIIGALEPKLGLGFRIAGIAIVTLATTEAMHVDYAADRVWVFSSVDSVQTPYAGIVAAIVALLLVAIGSPMTALSLLAWTGAGLLTSGYLLTSSVDGWFEGLSDHLMAIEQYYPVAARQHIFLASMGTGTLFGFSLMYLEVAISNPIMAALIGGACVVSIGWLLWSLNPEERQRARINVSSSVALTGVFVVGVPIITRPSVQVSAGLETPAAIGGQFLVAVSLAVIWFLINQHLVATQSDAASRFLSQGRQINTASAAVVAYCIMVASASLGLVGLIFIGTLYYLLPEAGTLLPLFVGTVCAVPFGYYIGGSTLQLRGLLRQMTEFRRRGRPVSASALDLPFEPDQQLWLIDQEGFLAGAYYDPFRSAILLSQGAVDQLTTEQLAAVVAHEESHFEHRGAFLQFIFTLGCSFTLLGKNVVFSVYDFRERELTADKHAVDRLSELYPGRGAEIFVSVLGLHDSGALESTNSPLAGFFPTLYWSPKHIIRGGCPVFAQLYGTFAGQVHPSEKERAEAISDEYDIDATEVRRSLEAQLNIENADQLLM